MAAVTVDTQSTDNRTNPKPHLRTGVPLGMTKRSLNRCKLRSFGTINIGADQDTLDTGITSIVEVAWAGTSSTDLAQPTWDAAGQITFTTAGGTASGTLYVWSGI